MLDVAAQRTRVAEVGADVAAGIDEVAVLLRREPVLEEVGVFRGLADAGVGEVPSAVDVVADRGELVFGEINDGSAFALIPVGDLPKHVFGEGLAEADLRLGVRVGSELAAGTDAGGDAGD